MKVAITVTTPCGLSVQQVQEIEREGDLEKAISLTFSDFRITHPDVALADSTVRIEHAQ